MATSFIWKDSFFGFLTASGARALCFKLSLHFLDRRLALVGLRYSKPRISGFLKRTLKRKTFFSSE